MAGSYCNVLPTISPQQPNKRVNAVSTVQIGSNWFPLVTTVQQLRWV